MEIGITNISLENHCVAQKTHAAMGTAMTHKVYGCYASDSLLAICSEIARIEGLLSRFLPGSDVYRINRSAGRNTEKINRITFDILEEAVEFSRSFPGCFDVTIGPLVKLWHEAKEAGSPPEQGSIKKVLSLVNYQDLLLDPIEVTVGLRNPGQSVDLGGIGKGLAGDIILEILHEHDISSAYSNLGGNVVTLGTKPDDTPWGIGIQHPRKENHLIGVVSVAGKTVVTSGDYQRYFIDRRGVRHHHILNPATGYPSQSGLVSVTIVAERSLIADVLSTAVFIAGLDKGMDLLSRYPGAEAILVDTDLQVFITKGLENCFRADQGIHMNNLD